MKCLCRAAPSGYLPAADDYEDQAGARNDDLAGYSDPAGDGYGAPSLGSASNTDPSYAAGRTADGYAALAAESDYSAEDDYGAPGQYQGNQDGFSFTVGEDRQGSGSGAEEAKQCPGGSLDLCVEVCPGNTARVYGACVQGCGDRCPQI